MDISKTLMYEFWYDYLKPKYDSNIKLCYMDTDCFIFHVKTEYFYKDISDDVKDRFDTSVYSSNLNRPLPTGMNKKVLVMFKYELSRRIMTELVALRTKIYSCLDYHGREEKKTKGTKCVVKRKIKFSDYKICLFNNNPVLRSQEVFKIEFHDVYTLKLNEIRLSSNYDKRLQKNDKIATYPYGTGVGKVCKTELLSKVKLID